MRKFLFVSLLLIFLITANSYGAAEIRKPELGVGIHTFYFIPSLGVRYWNGYLGVEGDILPLFSTYCYNLSLFLRPSLKTDSDPCLFFALGLAQAISPSSSTSTLIGIGAGMEVGSLKGFRLSPEVFIFNYQDSYSSFFGIGIGFGLHYY